MDNKTFVQINVNTGFVLTVFFFAAVYIAPFWAFCASVFFFCIVMPFVVNGNNKKNILRFGGLVLLSMVYCFWKDPGLAAGLFAVVVMPCGLVGALIVRGLRGAQG